MKILFNIEFLDLQLKQLIFHTIILVPRILLIMDLGLFRYRMRFYVNYITTSNDNSWMMLI